uniref:Carboxypeptidase A2-like n=1 Tax=Cyprinus carpio TaxID=7962 RepID=A0A8C2J3H7_CYPCA
HYVLILLKSAGLNYSSAKDQVLRIHAESENHIQILKKLERDVDSGLDFWTHAVSTEQPVDIRVSHSSLYALKDFLKKNNIPFTVIINNVQEHLVREREEMVRNADVERQTKSFNFAAYHDLETIYSFMDTLVASHSNLISKVNIGRTYENRTMYVLKFSTGGVKKPAIWIDAGIHAREWISHATAVWLADRIATDFKENRAPVPSILSQMDIYLMIVANPDGYVFTHRSPNFYRLWRKSRSATSNPKCHGVDLNRNWDAEFGGPGASDDPCAEDYRGPSAQSEIEVKNIADFIMSHGNFKSFMTLHSYKQLLMYPYGYSGTDAPDRTELHDVATQASKALNSWHGTVYKVGSIFHIIEPASGASVDWAYNRGIKYSFAFELRDTGEYGFLLPANQIVSTARETWYALRYIMQYVCDHPY